MHLITQVVNSGQRYFRGSSHGKDNNEIYMPHIKLFTRNTAFEMSISVRPLVDTISNYIASNLTLHHSLKSLVMKFTRPEQFAEYCSSYGGIFSKNGKRQRMITRLLEFCVLFQHVKSGFTSRVYQHAVCFAYVRMNLLRKN